MKTYPSIGKNPKGKSRERQVHVFDKLDGSNLRFEWAKTKGWFRWGSRRRVIDTTHPILGSAWALFQERLANTVEKAARDNKWDGVVAFAEFWGVNSLAGQHEDADEKKLTLFDVAPVRRGMVGPVRFLELFSDVEIPRYLGEHVWDEAFVAKVRASSLDGVTFEGVVGKAGDSHSIVMAKAKTQAWVDRILERYGEEEGRKLINS